MTKINFEEDFGIYLFAYQNQTASSSKLGEFMSFLKFHRMNSPYKFSFVSKVASLIPEMTLNQNILIDFSPNSLTGSKEVQFQEFLKDQNNRALEKLYRTIELPHKFPETSSAQMKKVCSLIKSLLHEGEFIFLEEPEVDLSPETLELFIMALKNHVKDRHINVFIFSKNLPMWSAHATKSVNRLPNYSFEVAPILEKSQWQIDRERFFSTPSNAKTGINDNLDGLKFSIPKTKNPKKVA